MAVIIHEFEMDVQPESSTSSATSAASTPESQPIGPDEVARLLRCQSERARRVWAY